MSRTNQVLSVLFFVIYVSVVESNWQRCNSKCYYLGKANVTFADLDNYCRTMSAFSTHVKFGFELEQSIKAELATCRLNKSDGEPYWISKHKSYDEHNQSHTDPGCRTVLFSGNDAHFPSISCLSLSNPFCETDNTSFCQTSNKTDAISQDWVRVAGQSPLYKLSSGVHTYCNAQYHCENRLHGQIAREGNYSFMGYLAIELGITKQVKIAFWLSSPGISCPHPKGQGSVMRYTGPFVHMVEHHTVNEQFRVLCEKKVTTTSSTILPTTVTHITSPTTQPSMQTNITSPITPQTTTHTNMTSPTTQPSTTQTNMTSSTTQLTTAQTNMTSTTTQPTAAQTNMTSPTKQPTTAQTNMTSPTTSPPTTQTNMTSSTTQPQTNMTSLTTQTPTTSTSMTSPTTQPTTAQTNITSPTTQPTTAQTNMTSPTTQPTTTQINMTSPTTRFSSETPSKQTNTTRARQSMSTRSLTTSLLTSSPRNSTRTDTTFRDPAWIRIGQEEYFVNYKPISYSKADIFCREKQNASLVRFLSPIKYFTILSQIALQNNSFWVGAHGMNETMWTDQCLSYIVTNMTMTTSPCHFEKFSVCSRMISVEIAQVLEDPRFRKMIQEMTVLRKETKKSIRKLKCAEDRRTSARAAGGVGVFIICSVITLLLLSDCSGIKSDFFNRKKKS